MTKLNEKQCTVKFFATICRFKGDTTWPCAKRESLDPDASVLKNAYGLFTVLLIGMPAPNGLFDLPGCQFQVFTAGYLDKPQGFISPMINVAAPGDACDHCHLCTLEEMKKRRNRSSASNRRWFLQQRVHNEGTVQGTQSMDIEETAGFPTKWFPKNQLFP